MPRVAVVPAATYGWGYKIARKGLIMFLSYFAHKVSIRAVSSGGRGPRTVALAALTG